MWSGSLTPSNLSYEEEAAMTDLNPPDHQGPRNRGRVCRQSR
jgi:hypothetical protein